MVLKPTASPMAMIECGETAAQYFGFAEGWRNLNHGSFGTYPKSLKTTLRHYQDLAETRVDKFIRYDYPDLLDQSRAAIATYINAPVEACVFVPNATTALNTVLRNLIFDEGDVILYFATIYGACEKTVDFTCETTKAESHKIQYTYPISDAKLCDLFEDAIRTVRAAGKTPKIAIYDTIVSLPGVRMPFERLTALCKTHGVLSCIDGAHSVGQIPMDLTTLDPDFYFSNCHKWLFVPRGCSVFYVPVRLQPLIRSTVPTSHGFQPPPKPGKTINNPMPPSTKSAFVKNFEYVGTMDNAPYLCVPAALQWRRQVALHPRDGKAGQLGEAAIMSYCQGLARRGGALVAQRLGTEILENEDGTLGDCAFSNVRLPLDPTTLAGLSGDVTKAVAVVHWISAVLVHEYDTFLAIIFYAEKWWVRLSAQIYLTERDFEWCGGVLEEVCWRVENGEWEKAVS